MGVHRNENLILQKNFFIYKSMGEHRKENLILYNFFMVLSMGVHRKNNVRKNIQFPPPHRNHTRTSTHTRNHIYVIPHLREQKMHENVYK